MLDDSLRRKLDPGAAISGFRLKTSRNDDNRSKLRGLRPREIKEMVPGASTISLFRKAS